MHENVVVPVKKVILMDIRVILSWCLGENCSMDVGIPGDCSSQCLFEVMELGVNSTGTLAGAESVNWLTSVLRRPHKKPTVTINLD